MFYCSSIPLGIPCTCIFYNLAITNKVNINQLDDIRGGDIEYHPVKNDDRWKVSVIKECIDVKFGRLDVDGFSADDLEEICYYLCIS